MIITKLKEFDDLLDSIEGEPVFIIGCSECATVCHTGGEKEVLDLKRKFETGGIEVTGWVVLDPACHLLNDKRLLRQHQKEINKSKKVLVLACGNGAQTVSEILQNVDVIPGLDTLFLGEIKRATEFEKRCMMCGECIQDDFDGFCPVTRCPKSMLNGPCGGAVDGKCEIDKDMDCVWDLIYKSYEKKGLLSKMKKFHEKKDWSKFNVYYRRI